MIKNEIFHGFGNGSKENTIYLIRVWYTCVWYLFFLSPQKVPLGDTEYFLVDILSIAYGN